MLGNTRFISLVEHDISRKINLVFLRIRVILYLHSLSLDLTVSDSYKRTRREANDTRWKIES